MHEMVLLKPRANLELVFMFAMIHKCVFTSACNYDELCFKIQATFDFLATCNPQDRIVGTGRTLWLSGFGKGLGERTGLGCRSSGYSTLGTTARISYIN